MGNGLNGQFDNTDFKTGGIPRLAPSHPATGAQASAPQLHLPRLSPQQLQFLLRVAPGALQGQHTHQIPSCVTIAQSILESATSAGWGSSSLFRLANNPFGIKYEHFASSAHGQTTPGELTPQDYGQFDAETWEIVNGQKREVIAQFQRFPNLTTAFEAHAQLLCSKRYQPAFAVRHDWKQFAERLGPKTSPRDTEHCGYSTNPEYGAALIQLVQLYHLDDPCMLDWLAMGNALGPEPPAHSGAQPQVSPAIAATDAESFQPSALKCEAAKSVLRGH